MKKRLGIIGNHRGIVTVIMLLVLLGVGVLTLNTVLNSQMNQTSSNNYKYKIQTFYAADGLMTLLAQDMIDTNENAYLVDRMSHQDIGCPGIAGSYSYDEVKNADTLKGAGIDILGNSDQFHYNYTRVKGDLDISVKVLSISNASDWSKAGIMIREKLTAGSKNIYVLRMSNSSLGLRVTYRTSDDGTTLNPLYYDPPHYNVCWIRLKRAGNTFSAFRSDNGSSWTLMLQVSVSMSDSVYAGLAVTSHNPAAICTGVFSNLSGLTRRSCSDSTVISGIGYSIPVNYTIDQTGPGVFQMTTDAYKLKGNTGVHNYTTILNQKISRARIESWNVPVQDSVFIPVTLYDMRSDMSNPEFNVYAVSTRWGLCSNYIRTDTLTADIKLIKKDPVASFRTCFMSCWDPAWYSMSAAQRTAIGNNPHSLPDVDNCFNLDPSWSWCFNDSMHTWFRPWGDSTGKTGSYSYDYVSNRWSGLKVRPGWTPTPGNNDTEWVATHWDAAKPFANIVLHDSLKFIEEPAPNKGVYTFGKDKTDPRWFVLCSENLWGGGCNSWSDPKFMPLQDRGFGFDLQAIHNVDYCDSNCQKKQNFAFSMEFHRYFTYKAGQTFSFTGDDDVFVFINNRCVIMLGGIHGPYSASVDLNTLGLIEGKQYPFDFFYAERCPPSSNILITTNILTYTPPQASRRNWKRDYGNID